MKEFNLEAAKNGAPVQTREGNPARIICWDMESDEKYIVALMKIDNNESIVLYGQKGNYVKGRESVLDLVMAPVKHEGWVNVYKDGDEVEPGIKIYKTEEEAKKVASDNCIATVKIEWEE